MMYNKYIKADKGTFFLGEFIRQILYLGFIVHCTVFIPSKEVRLNTLFYMQVLFAEM